MSDIERELLELAEEWRDDAEIWLDPDDENVSDGERGAALQQLSCAEQIEDLVDRHTDTDTERDRAQLTTTGWVAFIGVCMLVLGTAFAMVVMIP